MEWIITFAVVASIEALGARSDYVVMEVRGDLQALDVAELKRMLQTGDVFFEGNPFVGRTLQTESRLTQVRKLGIFMAPVSREEILFLRESGSSASLSDLITDVMRRKLLHRTRKQKSELSLKDLENIETRASSAYHELKMAQHFDAVLPNHDGEGCDNWEAFYFPLGDARKSLLAFVSLLRDEWPDWAEKWEPNLLPQ